MTTKQARDAMINKTKVCAGKIGTEDYDTGYIMNIIDDDMAEIAWYTQVTSKCPIDDLQVI